MPPFHFVVLSETYRIVRFNSADDLPAWATKDEEFVSVTRTSEELSIVAPESAIPSELHGEFSWACLKVSGPFSFSAIGVISTISTILANAEISIFVISTFDTDYVLVKREDLEAACAALTAAGHTIERSIGP